MAIVFFLFLFGPQSATVCAAPTCAERTDEAQRTRPARADPAGGDRFASFFDRGLRQCGRGVSAEVFSDGAVRVVTVDDGGDETGVLTGIGGDEDVCPGLAPVNG
ncbi:hypothetical protein FVP77_04790 [Microbacterium hatanonis]|uniref:Secreted protein n=1 Tax=Microbacterium hatanonis TaxID=404366 RepID=A0A5C8I0Y4_9MICO|nr:hypothetical protein FVP77_04790 [Microbacterium hatanonis]